MGSAKEDSYLLSPIKMQQPWDSERLLEIQTIFEQRRFQKYPLIDPTGRILKHIGERVSGSFKRNAKTFFITLATVLVLKSALKI